MPGAVLANVASAVPVVGRTRQVFDRARFGENPRDVEIGAAERKGAGQRSEKEETHDVLIKWGWMAGG